MEIARLTATIDANTSGFTRAMKQVDGDLNSTSRHLKTIDGDVGRASSRFGSFGSGVGRAMKVGAIAVAGFGVAAGGLAAIGAYKAVQAASDLNETVSKTKVIFGKSSKDILAWSTTSAKALGQSRTQALEAASTFAVFGKSAGLSGKDLTGFSKELTGLSADLASFHNASPEETITAIGAALRGESEPIRRFGVLLDDASLRAEAMKQGLISTTKDALTPQQRALAAHALIMKQTKDAQGDFARTSGGLANQQRIFNAELENAKAAIGTSLLPLATAIMPKLTAAIPIVTAYIQQFTGAIQGLVGNFTSANGGMDGMTAKATSLFNQLRTYAIPIMAAFSSIISTVGQMAQKIAPALGQYLGAALNTVGRIASVAMPIVADAIEKVGPPIARIMAAMLKFNALVLNVMGKVIPPIIQALAPVFSTVFGVIGNILDAIASLLEGDFSGTWKATVAAIKALWITLPSKILSVLLDAVKTLVPAAAELGAKIITGIASAIASGAGRIGSAISGAIKNAITSIDIPGFSPPEHAAAQAIGEPLAKGVKMGFLNGTADLPEKIEGRLKAALERGKRAVERQQGAFQSAFGKLGSGLMRAFDAQTQRGVAGLQASGAALTPAEAALAAEQAAHEESQRLADKQAAQDALAKAQSEGDAQAIADAQRRIDELSYQDKIAALQKQAEAERAARDAETAQKVLDYEAEREAQRTRYEEQIASLEAFLQRRNVSAAEKNKRLTALMNDPLMRDALDDSGLNLGKAFAKGLDKSEKNVRASLRRLATLVQDFLELHSPAKKGPLSTLDSWWTAMPDTLLAGVDTSMIGQVAAGIAAPDMQAGGSGGAMGQNVTVIVNVEGSVQAEADLADTIRRELIRTGQRNGSIFGGYA